MTYSVAKLSNVGFTRTTKNVQRCILSAQFHFYSRLASVLITAAASAALSNF